MKRDIKVYEEYFAWRLVVDDGRCQGVICWNLLRGRAGGGLGEDDDSRHRRRGQALHRHDERLLVHG